MGFHRTTVATLFRPYQFFVIIGVHATVSYLLCKREKKEKCTFNARLVCAEYLYVSMCFTQKKKSKFTDLLSPSGRIALRDQGNKKMLLMWKEVLLAKEV